MAFEDLRCENCVGERAEECAEMFVTMRQRLDAQTAQRMEKAETLRDELETMQENGTAADCLLFDGTAEKHDMGVEDLYDSLQAIGCNLSQEHVNEKLNLIEVRN